MLCITQPHMFLVYLYPQAEHFHLTYLDCNDTKKAAVMYGSIIFLLRNDLHCVCAEMRVEVTRTLNSFHICILAHYHESLKSNRSKGQTHTSTCF